MTKETTNEEVSGHGFFSWPKTDSTFDPKSMFAGEVDREGCAPMPCLACGGSGMGKPMYRPEIDKVQRDQCYPCQGTGMQFVENADDWRCYCKDSTIRWVDAKRPHPAIAREGWFCTACLTEFLPQNAKSAGTDASEKNL